LAITLATFFFFPLGVFVGTTALAFGEANISNPPAT